jgi:zinc protease
VSPRWVRRRTAFVAAASALLQLASAARVAGREIPARPEQVLAPDVEAAFPDPAAMRHELGNGIAVFVAEDHSLPLVQISIAVAAGDLQDPPDRIGLAGLTAALLRRGGAGEWDPDAFDARADQLGAELDSVGGARRSGVSLDCSSRVLDQALPLLAAMVREPRFEADRVALFRDRLADSLLRREDEPLDVLDREWGWLMFGRDHYATRVVQADQLAGLQRDELVAFHRAWWRPERMVVAVSGDVQAAAVVAALERYLGGIGDGESAAAGGGAAAAAPRGGEATAAAGPGSRPELPPAPAGGVHLRHVAIPQAKIVFGHRTSPRSGWDDADEAPLLVLAEILGGDGTVSRLRRKLRAEEGLVYRASSRIELGQGEPGTLQVFLEAEPRRAARALALAREELLRLREGPVPAAELALARRSLLHLFPLLFDSAERRAGRFAEDLLIGRPHRWWADHRARVAAVTAADVLRVARRHLRPEDLVAVVVGDRELFLAGARADRISLERLFGPVVPVPPRDPRTLEPLAGEAR